MNEGVISSSGWRRAGLSEAVRIEEDDAAERLKSDRKVQAIIEDLKKRGVSENDVNQFFVGLPNIIGDWEKIKDKTLNKMALKSKRLAKKIKEALEEINEYKRGHAFNALSLAEAYFSINYSTPSKTIDPLEGEKLNIPPKPGLEDMLNIAARLLEIEGNKRHMEDHMKSYFNMEDRPYKSGSTVYAVKKVSQALIDLLPDIKYGERSLERRSPNNETAIIVTALLNPDEPIKANNVCAILKHTRKKYDQS